jgi:hypothetical protein
MAAASNVRMALRLALLDTDGEALANACSNTGSLGLDGQSKPGGSSPEQQQDQQQGWQEEERQGQQQQQQQLQQQQQQQQQQQLQQPPPQQQQQQQQGQPPPSKAPQRALLVEAPGAAAEALAPGVRCEGAVVMPQDARDPNLVSSVLGLPNTLLGSALSRFQARFIADCGQYLQVGPGPGPTGGLGQGRTHPGPGPTGGLGPARRGVKRLGVGGFRALGCGRAPLRSTHVLRHSSAPAPRATVGPAPCPRDRS